MFMLYWNPHWVNFIWYEKDSHPLLILFLMQSMFCVGIKSGHIVTWQYCVVVRTFSRVKEILARNQYYTTLSTETWYVWSTARGRSCLPNRLNSPRYDLTCWHCAVLLSQLVRSYIGSRIPVVFLGHCIVFVYTQLQVIGICFCPFI
jgi:hypothetical protein